MATVAKNDPGALPLAEVMSAYRVMVTSRKVDDKEIQLKQQNLVFFQINGVGHEGFLAAAARHLSVEKDWFFTYYRDRALAIALGMTPYEIFLGSAGAAAGPDSAGRQMPNHFGQKRLHLAGPSSPTGTQCLQGVGFA
ncbi:MAG TPA: thiamine pyrophosphate-dependent enzyme, partial [Thermoanaerobaculaceae bacterium]|nr:thiamine pyrophosphate-dependent enzyme [Thermoanaerobaculaceae bacterium]